MRQEMEEVCRMAGLDFIVNALVNSRCETVDLVAGHPIEAHYAGVEKARAIYGTRLAPGPMWWWSTPISKPVRRT